MDEGGHLTRTPGSNTRKGVCVWFTGLSGSGKTTTATALQRLLEERKHTVTLLDGDVVRTNLSAGLGFSKADRVTHLLRVAFVAAEVVRHGGIVISATISPYYETRKECRRRLGENHFIEVFVDTPLQVCQQRDPKGLYRRASSGEASLVSGIDDPYEPPESPEIRIDTLANSAEQNAHRILEFLKQAHFLR
jgi:sulfate adenylyltransferase